MSRFFTILFLFISALSYSQNSFSIEGIVTSNGIKLPYVNIYIEHTALGCATNDDGHYMIKNLIPGTYTIHASFTDYTTVKKSIEITNKNLVLNFNLEETESLNEVVVTGTMKSVNRLETPI